MTNKSQKKQSPIHTDPSRRNFLKKTGTHLAAGTLALTGCTQQKTDSSPNRSQQQFEWKMVTTWPKNFPAMGTGAERLAAQISAMTQGRIKIKVYGAGELVPALGVFDAVSRGTAEMGHSAAYYWKGKHEASQFFAAVPFGLTASEFNGWLLHGGGQALWDELYADFGLKPFIAGNTGAQMGGWFKRDINSLEDFKGLKMRIPGLGGEVLRELGVTVVTLAGGDIFQSLKSGAIDASEWIGPYNDLAFGFHQAADKYYWPGWQEPSAALELMVNKKAFDSLPKDLQKIVEAATLASNDDIYAEFTARNADALSTLVNKHKVQLKKFPDPVLAKLASTSKSVLDGLAQKNSMTKKVYESYSNYRKKAMRWGQISELGYMTAREQFGH